MKMITIKMGRKKFRVKDCKGLSSIRGMMFDNSDADGALIYGNSIWMPFVRQNLDLFFLDENKKVIEKKRAVPLTLNPKTWKIYKNKKAKYCLEIKMTSSALLNQYPSLQKHLLRRPKGRSIISSVNKIMHPAGIGPTS